MPKEKQVVKRTGLWPLVFLVMFLCSLGWTDRAFNNYTRPPLPTRKPLVIMYPVVVPTPNAPLCQKGSQAAPVGNCRIQSYGNSQYVIFYKNGSFPIKFQGNDPWR